MQVLTRALIVAVLFINMLAGCSGGMSEGELINSSELLIEKRQFSAAAIQLKTALQKNASSAKARYVLSNVLLELGDVAAAETELNKARSLGYQSEKVIPALGRVMLELGQYQKIINEFASVDFSDNIAAADIGTSISIAYFKTGQQVKGRERLDAALLVAPHFAPAVLLHARLRAADEGVEPALKFIQAEATTLAKNAEAAFFEGSLKLNGKRDVSGAIQSFERSIKLDPSFVPAYSSLIAIYLHQKDRPAADRQVAAMLKALPNTFVSKLYTAQMAYLDSDFKTARDLSQQLLRVAPNNLRVLYIAGAVEANLSNPMQASVLLNKAVNLSPTFLEARLLLTKTYLQSGQPTLALKALTPAFDTKSIDLEALLLAGEIYLQIGDTKNSEYYFSRARELKPNNPNARIALAVVDLAKGQDEVGFRELESISKNDEGVSADLEMISSRLQRNQFEAALAAVDALALKQPKLPLASFLRGRVLTLRSDFAGAQRGFEDALAKDSKYFPAVNGIVLLDVGSGRPEEGQKRLEEFIKKNPSHTQAMMTLADLRVTQGAPVDEIKKLLGRAIKTAPENASVYIMLVEYLLLKNENKAALENAQAAVAAVPNSLELIDAMGRAHSEMGDSSQAIITFGKLSQMQPNLPLPHFRSAQVYLRSNDRDAALRSLKQALAVKPDYLPAQEMVGAIELQAGRHQRALEVARNIQKQRPTQALGYMLEGEIEADRKRWDQAITAYKSGLEKVAPGLLPGKLHLALLVVKRFPEAAQFATSWLKTHPQDTAFRQYLADVALADQDWPSAERLYRQVLETTPDNPVVVNNIAWLMVKQNEAGARAMAEKALALAPKSAAALDTLATALANEKQYPKAIEFSIQAAAAAPDAPRYRLNLAKLLIKAGENARAKTELNRLAEMGEKYANQAEVADLLRAL